MPGFTGRLCDTPISTDPCNPDPCKNGGQCHPDGDDYYCECYVGWLGKDCEIPDPCEPEDPCQNGGMCVPGDGDGSYTCVCPDGWTGKNCDSPVNPPGGGYNCKTNNPCTPENIAAGNFYFPHDDPKMFVQCDAFGGCFEMPCGPGTEWDQDALTCNHAKKRELEESKLEALKEQIEKLEEMIEKVEEGLPKSDE